MSGAPTPPERKASDTGNHLPVDAPPPKPHPIGRFAHSLSRHPMWCLLVAMLLTGGAIVAVARELRVETDLTTLLPQDSEVVEITRQALTDFGGFDFMYAVLEAPEPGREQELFDAAAIVASALDDRSFFRAITYRVEPKTFASEGTEGLSRRLALMTEADWKRVDDSITPTAIASAVARLFSIVNTPLPRAAQRPFLDDPLNIGAFFRQPVEVLRGPLKASLNRGYFLSPDGRMLLILLRPVKPSTDLLFSNELRQFLANTKVGLRARHPEWSGRLTLSFYGAPVETVGETEQLRADAQRTALLSSLFVIVFFGVVFRRPEALPITLLPTLLGLLWTVGIAALTVGRITQVTAMFGPILIGLGVDFSIHLYNRFLEEVRGGEAVNRAVEIAMERASPSVFAGAVTSSLAFFSMTATNFLGFRELGLLVGSGVLLCLVATFLLMPALLRVLGRFELRLLQSRPLPGFWLGRARYLAQAYPRLTMILSFTLIAFLALQSVRIRFDSEFRNLREPSDAYKQLRERIESSFLTPSGQVIVVIEASSLDDALRQNDQLFSNITASQSVYPILAVDSLRTLLPSKQTQRSSLERMARFQIERLKSDLQRLGEMRGIAPEAFENTIAEVTVLRDLAVRLLAADRPVVVFDGQTADAFTTEVQRYIYRPREDLYRIATQIYPPKGTFEDEIPPAFRDSLANKLTNPPQITGLAIIAGELKELVQRDLAFIVLLVTALLFVYLSAHFRSFGRAALAMLPLVTGSLCTLGLAELMDIRLDYLNIVALPVILGIGVDAGVHLLQRYYETAPRDIRVPIERTGRAIVLSSISTALGFASLLTAGFNGIREVGILVTTGVLTTLAAAVVLLPALLRMIYERRALYMGGAGDELG